MAVLKLEKSFPEKERKPEIRFNPGTGTLIIGLDKKLADFSKVREEAKTAGLNEKEEMHVTIIGTDTAKKILAPLKTNPEERRNIFSKISGLARRTGWKFEFKPEFYFIKKEYDRPDPKTGENVHETRESIIQMVDTKNLVEFYEKLSQITDQKFELPLPHVTLFTTSTLPEKKQTGISIYSREDFESLNPQKIEDE